MSLNTGNLVGKLYMKHLDNSLLSSSSQPSLYIHVIASSPVPAPCTSDGQLEYVLAL